MKNLQFISTSYRIQDLAEVGFAFCQRVKGFLINRKGKRNKRYMRIYTSWQQAEKKMKSEKYINLGKGTAIISFFIGTLIFGIYFLTSNSDLLFIGYGFIVLAGITNLIILIAILAKSKSDLTNRKRLLKTSGLTLINLPIMFLFIWFSLILIGNMRITFTNSTQNKLTDIKIVGCVTEYISELKPNESKTVWVEITGDYSINLEYLDNGELKKEMVAGYVTSGMGQKIKHKFYGKDKDIL